MDQDATYKKELSCILLQASDVKHSLTWVWSEVDCLVMDCSEGDSAVCVTGHRWGRQSCFPVKAPPLE